MGNKADSEVHREDILRHVEMMPGAGWGFSPGDDEWFTSNALAERLGLQPAVILRSSDILRLLHTRSLSRLLRQWKSGQRNYSEFNVVHPMKLKNGSHCGMRISARRVSLQDGKEWWLGTCYATESEAHSVLRASDGSVVLDRHEYDALTSSRKILEDREQQLRLVVTALPAVVWETRLDGSVTFFNRRSEQFPDFTVPATGDPHAAMMVAMRSVIHPDDQDGLEKAVVESMRTGEGWKQRYRRRTEDGYRWLEGRTKPYRNEEGKVVRWYGMAIDVDDEVKSTERLRSSTEELERITRIAGMAELSASISHEVSQPLMSLVASADACRAWLATDPPNVGRARASAEAANRDAQTVVDIVRSLRTMFQRGEEEKLLVSINAIVSDVCDIFLLEVTPRKLRLKTSLDVTEPLAFVDAMQIRQVLMNLLRNAVEAMEQSGSDNSAIHVVTNCVDEEITVSVENEGSGIDDLPRIFDAFYTTKRRGMGMGLSICRTVIMQHGGRIKAENTNDGARLWFTLKRGSS